MLRKYFLLNFCLILLCYIRPLWGIEKDVVFVVDTSGSIAQSDFDMAIDFLYDVVNTLTIGTADVQISVVTFSDTTVDQFDLNHYTIKANLLAAITALKSSITTLGGTFTADALNYVQGTSFTATHGKRGAADSIVVVMTDGLSSNTLNTKNAAENIRSTITDSIIYALGVGSALSSTTQELLYIINDTDTSRVLYTSSFVYICNLVPSIAVAIDPSISVSVAGDCEQVTTTVWSGKGGKAAETTTAAATTTTTAAATTTTTAAATTTTTAAATITTTATAITTATATTTTAAGGGGGGETTTVAFGGGGETTTTIASGGGGETTTVASGGGGETTTVASGGGGSPGGNSVPSSSADSSVLGDGEVAILASVTTALAALSAAGGACLLYKFKKGCFSPSIAKVGWV